MTEPTRYTFTKTQLVERGKEFMRNNFKDADRDWYYTRLGLLVDYIDHLAKNGEVDDD